MNVFFLCCNKEKNKLNPRLGAYFIKEEEGATKPLPFL